MFLFFSITTCAYIVMQFLKLTSSQESLQDPMYYVLLRHDAEHVCKTPDKYVFKGWFFLSHHQIIWQSYSNNLLNSITHVFMHLCWNNMVGFKINYKLVAYVRFMRCFPFPVNFFWLQSWRLEDFVCYCNDFFLKLFLYWIGGGSSWQHVRCVKYGYLWGRWMPKVVRRPHGAICGKHYGWLGEV